MVGFGLLALGLLDAIIALISGIIALARGGPASRGAAVGGLVPAAVVLGAVLVSASTSNGPRINDIATDTENPPEFTQLPRLEENVGRDMSYPGAEFARQQLEGYGKIVPLALPIPPGDAFAKVYEVANAMETWEIVLADSGQRKIEGIDTTWLFRFKDDFVIEVRDDGKGGSLVHMRSKSRDGKGDLRANANRIAAFFEKLMSK